jgi:hypothetical protein
MDRQLNSKASWQLEAGCRWWSPHLEQANRRPIAAAAARMIRRFTLSLCIGHVYLHNQAWGDMLRTLQPLLIAHSFLNSFVTIPTPKCTRCWLEMQYVNAGSLSSHSTQLLHRCLEILVTLGSRNSIRLSSSKNRAPYTVIALFFNRRSSSSSCVLLQRLQTILCKQTRLLS